MSSPTARVDGGVAVMDFVLTFYFFILIYPRL